MKKSWIRAFVVDDDRSFRRSLRRLLQGRGLLVDCFESAHEFLDSVPPGQEGIAIVDIHMPRFDGFFLMDQMKAQGYDMPVILITGLTGPNTRDMAMDRGAVGFLQKPFLERSIMALIESQERH